MTLSDLKKDAHKYTWTITAHPYWHKSFGVPREIKHVQSNAVQFSDTSWLCWPKASECCFFMSDGYLCFSVDLGNGAMTYQLEQKGKI
jgi:hypothetical protein